jgi:hypothetical protein
MQPATAGRARITKPGVIAAGAAVALGVTSVIAFGVVGPGWFGHTGDATASAAAPTADGAPSVPGQTTVPTDTTTPTDTAVPTDTTTPTDTTSPTVGTTPALASYRTGATITWRRQYDVPNVVPIDYLGTDWSSAAAGYSPDVWLAIWQGVGNGSPNPSGSAVAGIDPSTGRTAWISTNLGATECANGSFGGGIACVVSTPPPDGADNWTQSFGRVLRIWNPLTGNPIRSPLDGAPAFQITAIDSDLVVFATTLLDRHDQAYNFTATRYRSDGASVWHYEDSCSPPSDVVGDASPWMYPTATGKLLVIGPACGQVLLDPATGATTPAGPNSYPDPDPNLDRAKAALGDRYYPDTFWYPAAGSPAPVLGHASVIDGVNGGGLLFGFDPPTGQVSWSSSTCAAGSEVTYLGDTALVVGSYYVPGSFAQDALIAIDTRTGDMLWSMPLPGVRCNLSQPLVTMTQMGSAPDSPILIVSTSGQAWRIDPA